MNRGQQSTNSAPQGLPVPSGAGAVPALPGTVPVKQERHDEAEIRELAAQMVAANKVKMSSANRQPVRMQGQSMNIQSYLTRTNSNTNSKVKNEQSQSSPTTLNDRLAPPVDEDTLKGHFGWTTLGKTHIPYIFRAGEKYVAVRMVELKVLNKYLSFLHQDIYNCTCIRSYYISESEGRLLNEINFVHCDSQFGRDQFSTRDSIVRLYDANEFYKFLDACYDKLLNGNINPLDRCGFIRINKESVVPYTIFNSLKYVPLFYFEGETDNLRLKANKLEGWDLSYLKFCCKVQGIRNELFAHDSCSVISLEDIKNYFPPGTLFEDYWPNKMVDTQLLINGKAQNPVGQWTRQPAALPPTHPPPSPKPATQPKPSINNQLQNVQPLYNYPLQAGQAHHVATQPRATAATIRYPTVTPNTRQTRPNYYSSITQAPPPLVRASQTYPGYGKEEWNPASYNVPQTTAMNYMMMGETTLAQTGYRQTNPALHKYPPPLIPVRHLNGGLQYEAAAQNHYAGADVVDLSGNNQLINQQPAHQQSSVAQEDKTSLSNGRQMPMLNNRKLTPLPETPTGGTHIPYKLQNVSVENKTLCCINMKPFVHTELLVTLADLVAVFFNYVTVQTCNHVMQVLGIELYKGNNQQMQVLMKNGKCQSVNDIVPLVHVRNVIDYMPQLKYMLGGLALDAAAASKRQMNNS